MVTSSFKKDFHLSKRKKIRDKESKKVDFPMSVPRPKKSENSRCAGVVITLHYGSDIQMLGHMIFNFAAYIGVSE